MIPRKLVLEGVYSYRKRQEIDFTSLTSGGIFGIFGSVGSGKSAILEAVTYALYGQIERLSQTEQRGYNMMNLQSSRLFIDFEFSHGDETYRFTVSAKRQKKDFSSISSPERQGYRLSREDWIPLESSSVRGGVTAETILGLSYEHFRRTVIIPQGKFQEFIQLTPTNRTAMIETLFNLERFNLFGRTAARLNKVKAERSHLEGRQEEMNRYSREDLKEVETKQAENLKHIQEMEGTLTEGKARLQYMDETVKMRQEEHPLKAKLESLDARLPEIQHKESSLNRYKTLQDHFSPLFRQKQILSEQLKKEKIRQERILSSARELLEEQETEDQIWKELSAGWERKESLKEEIRSFRAAGEIYRHQKELKSLNQERDEMTASLDLRKKAVSEKSTEREILQKQILQEENALPDWEEIREIEDLYTHSDRMKREKEALEKQLRTLREQLEALLAPLIKEALPGKEETKENETVHLAGKILSVREEAYASLREVFHQNRVQLDTEKKLLSLSGELTEGDPCPLCGSPHHPSPLSIRNFSERENELGEIKQTLKTAETSLQTLKGYWYNYQAGSQSIGKQLEKFKAQLNSLEEARESHNSRFSTTPYRADDSEAFRKACGQFREQEDRVRRLYRKREDLDRTILKLKKEAEGTADREKDLALRVSALSSSVEVKLELLLPAHRESLPPDSTEEEQALKSRLDRIEKEYPLVLKKRQSREEELSELEKEKAANTAILEDLTLRLKTWETEMGKALEETEEKNPEEIDRILGENRNIDQEQRDIDAFRQERLLLSERLEVLQEKLTGREYDPETHAVLKGKVEEREKNRSALLTVQGSLRKQREDLLTGLEEKELLEKQLEKILAREENLKELTALFKGKKFTEYIASIYLQELCQRANDRFFPLTNQTLELVFENNAILVRDYLNEGKTRLVKTLSGGQTFQAALSLALALTDQIGMGGDHFFFLDEGFGTLDRETLETVIATLRKLSRDGRIIGLISHVEDLKQELDVWLEIRRTAETGSTVTSSWL